MRTRDSELFHSAFNYASIGMALIGLNGQWLDVNKSLCRITGYSKEELYQLTFQDITHPDDLEEDLLLVKQLQDGQINSYELEKRYFHKNGHIVWVLLSVSMVRDENGTPLYFISQIQDITERKTIKAKLEKREEDLNFVLQNSPDMIARLDKDFRFLFINEAITALRGIPPEAFIGKTIYETEKSEASRERFVQILSGVINSKKEITFDFNGIVLIDRHFLVTIKPELDTTGEVQTVLVIMRDISKRKNTELALQKANEELREALENVKQLQAILPICSYCKNIRDDQDYWQTVETYISKNSDTKFSHSICPNCYETRVQPELDAYRKRTRSKKSVKDS
jgi:PAS domain S-box-containing protein